jgi:hypothetical protein
VRLRPREGDVVGESPHIYSVDKERRIMRGKTRQTYETLCQMVEAGGDPPTIRELTEEMGLNPRRHTSTVWYSLKELEELELIEKQVPQSVGIYVPVIPEDPVDWKALEGGDGAGEAVEEKREGNSGLLQDKPDSQEGG